MAAQVSQRRNLGGQVEVIAPQWLPGTETLRQRVGELDAILVYAIFHALKPPHARHRVTLYRVHLGEALLLISSER